MDRIRLLILDCDGVIRTILWPDIHGAYVEIADHFGKRSYFDEHCDSVERFRAWHDHDWHKSMERLGIPREKYAEASKIYHDYYDQHTKVFPWFPGLPQKLSMKYTLAMFSSSRSLSVRNSLRESEKFFSCIVGAEHVTRMKPDPEGIHLILKITRHKREEALMIGDGHGDIIAGKNAGIKTAGVTWGIDSKEVLCGLNPDFLFEDPKELFLL